MSTKTPRQIERELAADMDWTRREYERVARDFSRAVKNVEASGLQPPDGLVLIESAGKALQPAYERYREALQRFTAFVIQPPEQESAAGA